MTDTTNVDSYFLLLNVAFAHYVGLHHVAFGLLLLGCSKKKVKKKTAKITLHCFPPKSQNNHRKHARNHFITDLHMC